MELSGKLKLGGLAKSKRNRKQRQNHLRLKLNHFWGRGNFCGKKTTFGQLFSGLVRVELKPRLRLPERG